MGTKAWTKLILVVTTLGLIGYDIWVAQEPTEDDTISEVMNLIGNNWPIIPFAWGVLTAHLFTRKNWKDQRTTSPLRYVYLGASGVVVLAGSWLGFLPDVGMVPWLLAGSLAGWALWPQFSQNFPE